MKTVELFRKSTYKTNLFIFYLLVFAVAVSVTPAQAQVTIRDHRTNESNVSNTPKISYKSLDHFWNNSRTDNFSTATANSKSGALAQQYRFVRTDGYLQKEPSNAEGQAVPLYLYYSNTRKDNFITATAEGIRAAEAGGYRKVRIEGYVLKTVKPEYQHLYKPLWLYYHDTRKDNFTIATPQGMRTAERGGYRKVRIEGYVSITNRNSAPQNEVALDDSRNDFLVTNPPRSTQEDIEKWNRIVHKMQGIEGFDPVNNIIGSAPVEKNWPLPIGYKNNWIPLDKQKQVCCGKLENFKTFDGRDDEMDWNFHILPNDDFSFLITKALPYKKKPFPIKNPKGWHINKKNRDHRPGYEWKKYTLEAEVTPSENLFQNVFFPIQRKKGRESNDPKIGLEGKEICVYGPWIREWFHHNRPEIHPSEMIWWRESKGYYMMLIQDGSQRFDDKDKFDFGFLGGSAPDNWKPWAKSPLTAQFKIAFEVNTAALKLPLKMDIREVYNRFVVTKEDPGASADIDKGSSHTLVVDNKKLLVVNEQQANDTDLGVKFVDITKRADGTIQGYLQITTKVGGPNKKDIGYHLIYVSSSNIPVKKSDVANRNH